MNGHVVREEMDSDCNVTMTVGTVRGIGGGRD